MTPAQLDLFGPPPMARELSPSQQECVEALRWLVVPGTAADIQRCLAEHGITRQVNCIAKRLGELESKGFVERTGREYQGRGITRTTWRRLL